MGRTEFNPLPNRPFKDDEHQDLYEQLKYREDLEQCEIKNSEFIQSGYDFWRKYGFEMKTPQDELDRLILQECERYNTDYITRNEIKRMKDEYLIRNPKEELNIE